MEAYLIDVNIQEPDLLKLYAELLPQVDAVASPLGRIGVDLHGRPQPSNQAMQLVSFLREP